MEAPSETQFPLCRCRKVASLKTAWTNANPGRRFLGCGRYGMTGACKFFAWVDDPADDQYRKVILGLLRRVKEYEMEANKAKEKKHLKKKTLFVFILGLFIVFVGFMK
ncbi:uncharacterized protein LOC126661249 [Mercurialis annua]|uniref:uncharacterized protein LOC126661249 n=1 Tax=Mercurialis annua TaxID=3986 RepID=UPI00215F8A51|nr:uncharacterized protein LOC126661249 [Mercurialis annua]